MQHDELIVIVEQDIKDAQQLEVKAWETFLNDKSPDSARFRAAVLIHYTTNVKNAALALVDKLLSFEMQNRQAGTRLM